jgi:hypothetical protein
MVLENKVLEDRRYPVMDRSRPTETIEEQAKRLLEEERAQSLDGELREETPESCAHMVLMPRWDAIEDMGKLDRVVGYRCDGCGQNLSLEQGHEALERGAMLMGSRA